VSEPVHPPSTHAIPPPVRQNITTIAELLRSFEERASGHQRAIEAIIRRVGRPKTLYGLVALVAAWMIYNVVARWMTWPLFDPPPFNLLCTILSVFSAAVTTMVLTAQLRLRGDSERRAHLELQVSLLAEQEATKVIQMLEELRRDLPNVRDRHDEMAEAFQEAIDPKSVISTLEETLERTVSEGPAPRQRKHGRDDAPR